MPNIRLTIAYDGTNYSGWQIQKNALSIQAILEKALRKILNTKIKVTGAGRTDAGVHANGQIANFNSDAWLPEKNLKAALNSTLPEDISVIKVKKVSPKFNSQFDARSKVYKYTILNDSADRPLCRNFYWKVPYRLNMALMRKEAKALEGKHDFRAFQAKSALSGIKDTKRIIKNISISAREKFIFISIEGNGFLHNMVRVIIGTLVEVGRGYMNPGSVKKILLAKDRRKAGPTAPAKGLTLISVRY